ncbi:hypothetical protein TIFTF001_002229 [Ficus carica]|uniref:Uncharacterized protein n=1 Tax=Ficus carica TaxID=3494 RepID=A0AA87ZLV0_FICCA|nr:hypothetical protein TIFTF001_002229 [Ficus carica]
MRLYLLAWAPPLTHLDTWHEARGRPGSEVGGDFWLREEVSSRELCRRASSGSSRPASGAAARTRGASRWAKEASLGKDDGARDSGSLALL